MLLTTTKMSPRLRLLNLFVFLSLLILQIRAFEGFRSSPKVPNILTRSNSALKLDLQDFGGWIDENKIQKDGLSIQFFDGMRGVQADTSIKAGTVVLRVPEHLSLSDSQLGETTYGQAVPQEKWQGLFWLTKLAIVLTHEFSMGTSSSLAPWLGALPEVPPPVPFNDWPEDALLGLQDSLLQAEIDGISFWFSSQYDEAFFLGQEYGIHLTDYMTRDEYLKMIFYIQSRTFLMEVNGRMKRFLVPFMDMFNHKAGCESEFFYDAENHSINLRLDYSVAAGSQVFINYGEHPNSHFLKYYGFIPEENQFDSVIFQGLCDPDDLEGLGLADADFAPGTGKAAALEAHLAACEGGREGHGLAARLPALQDEYLAGLRLLVATAEEIRQAGGPDKVLATIDDPLALLTRANEARAARVAQRRCLKALDTTAAGGEAGAAAAAAAAGGEEGEEETEAQQLARRYRAGRRRLLAALSGRLGAYAALADGGGEGGGGSGGGGGGGGGNLPSLNAFLYQQWQKGGIDDGGGMRGEPRTAGAAQ